MKRIVSSQIKTALWPGGQLLQDYEWKRLEEGLWGGKPHSRLREDSGSPRKNVMLYPGLGSQWRENNPGAGMGPEEKKQEEPRRGIGSGYNDGSAAVYQDAIEAGPGHSPKLPEPYSGHHNELFLDLDIKNPTESKFRDKLIRDHLRRTMNQKPARIHKRYSVDRS
jgi:hypothetical protein